MKYDPDTRLKEQAKRMIEISREKAEIGHIWSWTEHLELVELLKELFEELEHRERQLLLYGPAS